MYVYQPTGGLWGYILEWVLGHFTSLGSHFRIWSLVFFLYLSFRPDLSASYLCQTLCFHPSETWIHTSLVARRHHLTYLPVHTSKHDRCDSPASPVYVNLVLGVVLIIFELILWCLNHMNPLASLLQRKFICHTWDCRFRPRTKPYPITSCEISDANCDKFPLHGFISQWRVPFETSLLQWTYEFRAT